MSNMRKSIFCLIALLETFLIILAMSGCGSLTKDNAPAKSDSPGTSTMASQLDLSDVSVTENPKQLPLGIETGYLGTVEIKQDENLSKSVSITPDTPDTKLSVTDSKGYTWTLTLPKGCVNGDTLIIMTVLSEIKGETGAGKPAGGVYLYPSGLEFVKPAALTVTGPGSEGGLLISGDHAGKKLQFMAPDKSNPGTSALVEHFSSSYLVDKNTFDGAKEKVKQLAREAYKDAEKRAKELLSEPLEVPPAPSFPITCEIVKQKNISMPEEFSKFKEAVEQPERSVFEQLYNTRAFLTTYFNDEFANPEVEQQILRRLTKKVTKLIMENKPQSDKLIPVSMVATDIWREVSILGYQWNEEELLSEWAYEAAEENIGKLKSGHDYKAAPIALYCMRCAMIFDSGDLNTLSQKQEKLKNELENALKFNVVADFDLTADNGDRISTEGSAQVSFKFSSLYDLGNVLKGTGSGKYTQYTFGEGSNAQLDNKDYSFAALIRNFDPCKDNTVNIVINKLCNDVEKIRQEDGTITEFTNTHWMVSQLFSDKLTSVTDEELNPEGKPFLSFKQPLNNGDAVASVQEYDFPLDEVHYKVKVQLIHTPQ